MFTLMFRLMSRYVLTQMHVVLKLLTVIAPAALQIAYNSCVLILSLATANLGTADAAPVGCTSWQ